MNSLETLAEALCSRLKGEITAALAERRFAAVAAPVQVVPLGAEGAVAHDAGRSNVSVRVIAGYNMASDRSYSRVDVSFIIEPIPAIQG